MAKIVGEYVKKWKVDSIITFDEGGVSGHINHRAVGAGVRYRPSISLLLCLSNISILASPFLTVPIPFLNNISRGFPYKRRMLRNLPLSETAKNPI